ncbi:MAG: tRNA (5-methylaminomethyl-2-thiouridine)(34)-methyltransferase MnmD [Proteobacteria bacterium]|nr:tRNA (5-methylaminomethyl-2-thiouridine)(34)-methyltransferase MnmD [Pseudomonadota bacterium]
MPEHQESVAPAQLHWRNGQPVSAMFDDIYFSADGAEEVRRVFLQPSRIVARATTGAAYFTVAELGFGTGLNFIVCADELLRASSRMLHFISVEAHPLRASDWRKVASQRPNSPTAQALAAAPPPLLSGWHRRLFHGGRIQLSVFHGDVTQALEDLHARQRQPIDAWFLDGFTPAKNPAMWQASVIHRIASLSTQGTTVATFTSAGQVRRDLNAAGFAMTKVDQRPFKRTSLSGSFVASGKPQAERPPRRVSVLGAGIAGATVAHQLAQLGIRVSVFDPNGMASGGSQMPVSALHARLLGDQTAAAEFRARAFHHARAMHQDYPSFRPTGALQLALNERELIKLKRIQAVYAPDPLAAEDDWLHYQTPKELLASAHTQALGGLYFDRAGLVDLPLLCKTLLDHSNIELLARAAEPADDQPWVIACGTSSREHALGIPLEVGSVWGQLDWIQPTSASAAPTITRPIVGNGYTIPDGQAWVVGSSYEYRPWEPAAATASNIESNRRFIGTQDMQGLDYKRAPRCVSSDRNPVIGRLAQQRWISTAHGSLGTSSAPLAASIIASDVMGWVPPVSARVLAALAPTRFIARQARRGVKVVGPAEP